MKTIALTSFMVIMLASSIACDHMDSDQGHMGRGDMTMQDERMSGDM